MKNILISLLFILFTFLGCQQKESPNIKLSQVIEDIKWDDNYSKIEQLFENNYGLEFDREIAQQDGNVAYKFIGANLNGLETESWIALFTRDGIEAINVMILSETDEQNSGKFQILKNDIEELPFDKQLIEDNFWVVSKDGNINVGINVIMNQNNIVVSIYISKNFNEHIIDRDKNEEDAPEIR